MSDSSWNPLPSGTPEERKCLFLLAVCLFFVIGGGFWWYGTLTEKQVYLASQRTGRGLVDTIMLRHLYQKLEMAKPIKDLEMFLGTDLSSQQYSWSFINPQPDGPNQPRDEFEHALRKQFLKSPPPGTAAPSDAPDFVERTLPGKQEYEYYQPVRAKAGACMECHNVLKAGAGEPALRDGELMAIVKVVLPNAENQDVITWNRAVCIATALITFFMAMVCAFVIVHYVLVAPPRSNGATPAGS